jgi:hypothetical protein
MSNNITPFPACGKRAADQRDVVVSIRVSPNAAEAIEKAASRTGTPLDEFLGEIIDNEFLTPHQDGPLLIVLGGQTAAAIRAEAVKFGKFPSRFLRDWINAGFAFPDRSA